MGRTRERLEGACEMSELKPCPFCGAEVQDDERGEKYPRKSPMGGWIIHCECCGASLSQFRKSGKGEISWNNRPIEDALNARIAELEGIVKADNLRLINAGLSAGLYSGCDTAEMMAEEILASRARIAELEAENDELKERVAMLDVNAVYKSLGEMGYIEQVNRLNARIDELEGKIDQLTAHGDIERQDDKSSNDTQKETFVYGKEREK